MTESTMRKATLLSACLLLVLAATAAADGQLDLVRILPGAPQLTDAVTAASLVQVEHALLTDRADGFRIQLPDGPVELAVRDGFERRGTEDLTWTGFIRFEPDSRVVLTLKDGYVSGYIRSRLGLYELRPHRGGGQILQKIDTGRLPECGGSREVSSAGSNDASVTGGPLNNDPANQIQLMALYTPQARDAVGGTAQIQSLIQAAVDASNTAFADSVMQARFVLAYAGLASYNDSGDMDADLDWVTADAGVAALRDQHGADMVSLLVGTGAYCGIAWVMRDPGPSFESSAFQVTHQLCAVGNLSFAHEHGHNMGFEHDPANGTGSNQASYPWSFGHYVNGSYRTVMAYSNGCNLGCARVGQFSNPSVTYNGTPTGMTGDRDNAQSGDSTAPIVADFRTSGTCGNGILEAGEECDGAALGGASCGAVGCSSGTPTCTSTCTLDYSTCSACGVCDFDGLCELGEDCNSCPSDCISGSGATCGNGICETADGEDCLSCPQDCNGKTGGKPANRFCCGDGDGPNPKSCSDPICSERGWQCSGSPAVGSCCGDGSCTGIETGANCSLDCGAPPSCGDGICDPSESSCSCSLDCGAPPSTELLMCSDGEDNDCDGLIDCSDPDCSGDPVCAITCEPVGASCTTNEDCCDNRCRGKKGARTCRAL